MKVMPYLIGTELISDVRCKISDVGKERCKMKVSGFRKCFTEKSPPEN